MGGTEGRKVSEPITEADLAALEALEKAATPGPWEIEREPLRYDVESESEAESPIETTAAGARAVVHAKKLRSRRR